MQFERLRKSHKKEIIIGGLVVLGIVSAITLVTTRAKYKLTQDLELVKGTINYKPYDFKVMAMYRSEDGTNYTEINEMPGNGYVINEDRTYCTIDNKTQIKGKIKTENGKHYISDLAKSEKCYLYFDLKKVTSKDTLVKLNITPKNGTPDFSKIATTNEGVYPASDGMYGGTSYYWRGAVTNNYIKFANFCWRIVRINGDGSIRLIYDGTTCHQNGTNTVESIAKTGITYNLSYNNSSYVGWTYSTESQRTLTGTASNAKAKLESWYSSNIAVTNASKIVQGKYCNDRDIQSGSIWSATGSKFYYASYKRLYTDYQPILSCNSGDIYVLNVGLITADEVVMAGGQDINNTSYYLYNGQSYWTMTPRKWDSDARMFIVGSNGNLTNGWVSSDWGLRPVINLNSDVIFSDGDGTQANPYVVQ